ncbi:hypothetical protein LCGC14_0655790 [marine sediment metagenome]|uniref:CPBP family intramembrane metalloprotease n=1 Tax=marine sediment metagenome TaxID=412755 RepID=A0A0F9QV05_9ZZZZ
MQIKPYVKEITITIIAFIWLLFVATNVNIQLGQTYLHFTLGSLALLIIGITIFDKRLSITFQKQPGGQLKAILWGLGGWIVLLITAVIVLKFIDPSQAKISAVIGLMGATTPALATSKIANLLTFGIAIAYVETILWARLMEFFADLFHIDISIKSVRMIFSALMVLIVILSLAFVFFHLTAKGITNSPALAIVFVMMMISLIMVAIFQEIRQAVYMHIWANTVASYLMLFATGILAIK